MSPAIKTKTHFLAVLAVSLASITPSLFAAESSSLKDKLNENKGTPSNANDNAGSKSSPVPLPSPYFIVGFLCEGITSEKANTLFPKNEDFSKLLDRENSKIACDNNFAALGIEKYQWLSPQDLEQLEFVLKREDPYADHKLEVIPAEGPGHVYLKLKLDNKSGRKLIVDLRTTFSGSKGKGNIGRNFSGRLASQQKANGPFNKLTYGINFSLMRGHTGFSSPNIQIYSPFVETDQRISQRWRFQSKFSVNATNHPLDNEKNSLNAGSDFLYSLTNLSSPVHFSIGPSVGYFDKRILLGGKSEFNTKADRISYYSMTSHYLTDPSSGARIFEHDWDYQSRISDEHVFWGIGGTIFNVKKVSVPELGIFAQSDNPNALFLGSSLEKTILNDVGVRIGYSIPSGNDIHNIAVVTKGVGYSPNQRAYYHVGMEYTAETQGMNIKLGASYNSHGPSALEPIK